MGGQNGLRLVLYQCPTCGKHGVVVVFRRGSRLRFVMDVWTFNEAKELHDRLVNAGGDIQMGFLGELERADYLVDDYYPNELTGLSGLMWTLGVPPVCGGAIPTSVN